MPDIVLPLVYTSELKKPKGVKSHYIFTGVYILVQTPFCSAPRFQVWLIWQYSPLMNSSCLCISPIMDMSYFLVSFLVSSWFLYLSHSPRPFIIIFSSFRIQNGTSRYSPAPFLKGTCMCVQYDRINRADFCICTVSSNTGQRHKRRGVCRTILKMYR
jgi:hypothetical protein